MKKISTLLMLFCAFVCSAWAGPTDLPEVSTDGNIKWYTIKNVRKGKFATYAGDNATMTQQATASAASFFYFTESTTEGAVKIHNYAAGDKLCAAYNSWTADGIDWYLKAQSTGVSICTSTGEWNAWNDAGGNGLYVEYWSASDAGSAWEITLVTDFSAIIDVPAAKTAAIAEVNNYAVDSSIYPAATSTVEAINAVTPENNSIAGLNAAIEAINAKVVDYKNAAYAALSGKYFSIKTPARGNGFMELATSKVVGTANLASPAGLWQFVCNNDGTLKVFNPYTGKYLCEPQGNSAVVAVTTDANSAGSYTLAVNASAENGDAKIKFTSNGKSVHMDGSSNLVRWDNGGASEWAVIEVTDYSAIINAYKNSTIATLDQWATLSVVFDASLIATAKESVNGIEANGFATFATIDAQLTTVTEKVAQKYFTFKNTDTKTAARVDAYLAANVASTPKEGYGTKILDYSAIWRLFSAGGTSFYLYNELNGLYLKNPSSGDLVENASDAGVYTFEIVDANTNTAELKCGGETLHLSNSCALMSYDNNDPASRWIIAEYSDFKAELQALVTENASNHAPVPALGQYPTEAYEALVAANETATSVAEVNAAVVAFKKAKNLPVFTISGTKDYVLGKSIYDNNSGTLYFKTTNNYDKSMWWAFDQTTATVGVTEEVVVTNYATERTFWGAPSVKITETSDANTEDGIFLLYTTGNGTPVHFQSDNSQIVRWSSTESNSGSAMTFTFIGTTYELAQLTDEKVTALAELEALYNAHKDAYVGEGLGKYTCTDNEWYQSFDVAVESAKGIVTKTLSEQATTSLGAINDLKNILSQASTKLSINLPVAGKYYRFQGACEASLPGYYITGHTNADKGRIALTAEADASTIYYFDGTNLIAYQSGLVIGLNNSHWTFASVDDNSNPASEITFTGSPVKGGAYSIKSADRYLHYTVYNGTVQVNRCSDDVCAEHAWYITEVTELPVTISAAGYASFYAPVAVTLPTGVTAHTVTENGEWATLSDAISVVPAENGVILAGAEGEYNLAVSNTVAENLEGALAGTVAKTLVTKEETGAYYVLGVVEGEVGLYNPVIGEDNTKFYNAGHKAYWYIPAGTQTAGFRFGGNTTAIESVLNNGVDANAPIYDLSGRRVNNAVKGGIYIKNGKKFIVK